MIRSVWSCRHAILALANYTEIIEGRAGPNGGVFLDITHRDKNYILEKLPRMYRQFMESQTLDISRQPMEVAPTAHYSMGGVVVDPETHATGVEGLYAAGGSDQRRARRKPPGWQLTRRDTGLRTPGRRTAAAYSQGLQVQLRTKRVIDDAHAELDRLTREGEELAPARPAARCATICGRTAAWCVTRTGCGWASKGLPDSGTPERVDVRPSSEGYEDLALALDLRGSLVAAEATLRCALERRESPGHSSAAITSSRILR